MYIYLAHAVIYLHIRIADIDIDLCYTICMFQDRRPLRGVGGDTRSPPGAYLSISVYTYICMAHPFIHLDIHIDLDLDLYYQYLCSKIDALIEALVATRGAPRCVCVYMCMCVNIYIYIYIYSTHSYTFTSTYR